jgi:hypothetical protein
MLILDRTLDPHAARYIASMTKPPPPRREDLLNELIFRRLKNTHLFEKLDIAYLIAAHDSQAAKLNLINPSTATITLSGSPVFLTDTGYQTDGSTSFLDTNRALNGGTNYTQNSASFGFYNNLAVAASGPSMGGAFSGAAGTTLNPWSTGTTSVYRCNVATSFNGTSGPGNSLGLTAVSRTGSAASAGYRNGVQLGTSATASSALTADTFKLGAITAAATKAGQFAFAFAGAGLTAADNAILYAIVLEYLTAIGAN